MLIVRAGDAGEVISREIIKRCDLGTLVGFIDDDKEKIGKSIHDRKVLGNIKGINNVLDKDIKEMEVLAKEMDAEGIVRKLQKMVPTYKPNRDMLM